MGKLVELGELRIRDMWKEDHALQRDSQISLGVPVLETGKPREPDR